jgi:hypothetical protein
MKVGLALKTTVIHEQEQQQAVGEIALVLVLVLVLVLAVVLDTTEEEEKEEDKEDKEEKTWAQRPRRQLLHPHRLAVSLAASRRAICLCGWGSCRRSSPLAGLPRATSAWWRPSAVRRASVSGVEGDARGRAVMVRW